MINTLDLEKKYGLMSPKSIIANTDEDAVLAAQKIGFPVALKIGSTNILHKTDLGGVQLNLKTEDEVRRGYKQIIESVKNKKENVQINGVLVQEMISEGFELIVGFSKNPVFGPCIMVGMGGILTEVFQDIVFRLLPITRDEINRMIDDLKFSGILLSGYRDIQAVNREMLVEVIYKISKMAMELGFYIESFDINPIVVWSDKHRILDFKFVKPEKENTFNDEKPNIAKLDKFFNAKSIALIGATDSKDRIGGIILDNLINHGYKGKVYPINPKYNKIMELKSYPSILEVDEKIDMIIVCVALGQVPEILKQCKSKNIYNVIIISAGGKEVGNLELEKNIKSLASEYGIRVIGCNCLGVFDGHTRIDTMFQPYDHMNRPKSGCISLISQSGTVGISYLELLDNWGISKFISYGNRIDVDEGDLISFLEKDPLTKVIAVYMEGLEKGRKFFEAAKKAVSKKPVVVYKAGRSKHVSEAAISHTGFFVGTYNLIKGAMDQANVVQVDSLEGLISSSKALSAYPRAKGNKVLLITNGAGATIQSIDKIVEERKLEMSKLSDSSLTKLNSIFPKHVIVGNPIDLTGTGTNEQYETAIKTAVNDHNIDIIMVWFVFQCKLITPDISLILKKYMKEKPIICGAIGADHTHKMRKLLEKEGVPIFCSVEEWVSAASSLLFQ